MWKTFKLLRPSSMLNRMRGTIPNPNSPGELGLIKEILVVKCSAASSLYTNSSQSTLEVESFGEDSDAFLPTPDPSSPRTWHSHNFI